MSYVTPQLQLQLQQFLQPQSFELFFVKLKFKYITIVLSEVR